MQDYIAMVLIWYATQAAETGASVINKDIIASLLKIQQKIDGIIG